MDIRQYIRDELKQDGSLQPADVAARIIERLSPKQKAEALTVALPSLVRDMIVQTRPSPSRPSPSRPAPNTTAKTKAAHSWKRQGISELGRELRGLWATADGYKQLREFSADQLDALAETLREQAAHSVAKATRMEAFAEAVRESGVDRLGDLDEDTLRVRLGDAA